jgi:hypothetical protein
MSTFPLPGLLFRGVEAFLCNFFHHLPTRPFVELPPDSDESG